MAAMMRTERSTVECHCVWSPLECVIRASVTGARSVTGFIAASISRVSAQVEQGIRAATRVPTTSRRC